MGFGIRWSTGFGNELGHIADGFNAAKTSNPGALSAFVNLVRNQNVELIEAQARTIFPNGATYQAAQAAANWYGTDGKPMWPANSVNRPQEIRAMMTEARVQLAQLLIDGAKDCAILGQCEQPKFEIWLTWPPGGFQGQTIKMWIFGPNHCAYAPDHAMAGTGAPETEAQKAAWLTWESSWSEAIDSAPLGPDGKPDLAALLNGDYGANQVYWAVRDLKPGRLLYKETPLAIADDRATAPQGSLKAEPFSDGHEPGMDQHGGDSKQKPDGPAAAGVKLAWER
jgi:hypothetical protein